MPRQQVELSREDQQRAARIYALIEGEPTPKRLADALKALAPQVRPDYWRLLRNAVRKDQAARGYPKTEARLAALRNPVTLPGSKLKPKPKQRRAKSISQKDYQTLHQALIAKGDGALSAAVYIAKVTGARPAELHGIERVSDHEFRIRGAKKRADGRGLDRTIRIDERHADSLAQALDMIHDVPVRNLQRRLDTLVKGIWPRRQARPSFYTLRHQMGADLKASGISRKRVAYLMGHHATSSVERYGDRRKASGGISIEPAVPEAQIDRLVRADHEPPLSQQQQRTWTQDLQERMDRRQAFEQMRDGPERGPELSL